MVARLSEWAYGWPCVSMWYQFEGDDGLWPESSSVYLAGRHLPIKIVWFGFVVNSLLRRFQTIQHHARDLLAKRRGIRTESLPWKIGCLHDLRDTFITGVKGLPLDVLKRVCGHSNVSTTLRYYTAETERDADDVRAALVNSGLAKPRMAAG